MYSLNIIYIYIYIFIKNLNVSICNRYVIIDVFKILKYLCASKLKGAYEMVGKQDVGTRSWLWKGMLKSMLLNLARPGRLNRLDRGPGLKMG